VEAAQHAVAGAGVVVLAEGDGMADSLIKAALIPALEKETPLPGVNYLGGPPT